MNKACVLAVSVFALTVIAFFAFVNDAWARSGAGWPFEKGYSYCVNKTCYRSDPYGGWGLLPQRTYNLVYDGGPACLVIRDALNRAIARGKAAEKEVTLPVPRYRDLETDSTKTADNDVKGNPFTYVSQNPLYSDPIFLKWNYLGGYPDTDVLGFGGAVVHAKADYWHGYDPNDIFPKRWMIAPYLNDGVPHLLTALFWGTSVTTHVGVPKSLLVWDAKPDELKAKDWNLGRSYASLKTIMEPWPNANEIYRFKNKDAIGKFMYLYPTIKNQGCVPNDLPAFPKINMPQGASRTYNSWYASCTRPQETMQIAQVLGRYYLVFGDLEDRIIVVDASKEPGDDECYLGSEITGKIR